MFKALSLATLVVLAGLGIAIAQKAPAVDAALVDTYVKNTFKNAPPEWQSRVNQDETQRVCSQYFNAPPAADSAKVLEREKASVVFPADGNVLGDWKNGQKLAQRGTGGQFSDKPETAKGGNCYACHQLSLAEVSYGTLGPSLNEYGKIRKFKPEEAKTTYAKIYNPQAVQPCSNMPRFGHNKFLNEQEIKDVVAYLFSPESPVNK